MTSYDYIIEEGVQIGVSNVAVQMLREGMPLTVVQRLTKLPLNVLENLSKTLSSSESGTDA